MKIFIQIFTIYLFSLSLAPCGDGGGGIMVIIDFLSGQEIVLTEQNNDPCENAPCSPFCICSSCVSTLDTPETELILPKDKHISIDKKVLVYHFSYLPSPFYKDIWQPPKLG